MNADLSLLVLAAGMGSRYGGLKQIDAFGPNGETILDYSIYDAIQAGFKKVVFVIRESFEADIRAFFAGKFDRGIEVRFVAQELTSELPPNFTLPDDRVKPWGTAHAVMVGKSVIKGAFAVINADDFYGRDSYVKLARFFEDNQRSVTGDYALVGYDLVNTLSDHGTVNRGVCEVDDQGYLSRVEETLKIGYSDDRKIVYPTDGAYAELSPNTPVSMNMWGFYPDYFDYCEESFERFLKDRGQEPKSEFFIPLLVDELIRKGERKIKVLRTDEEWFGVTYQKDKPFVIQRLSDLIAKGVYPTNLWS